MTETRETIERRKKDDNKDKIQSSESRMIIERKQNDKREDKAQ